MTDIVRDPYGNPLKRDATIDALRSENEKLRAAMWDIHAVCNNWDWFIWMWPIRRIKRLARAALEERS